MRTRCKFQCVGIIRSGDPNALVTFATRYCPEVEEDVRFTKYTPYGQMVVHIANPAVLESLKIGEAYYIDISSIE